MAINIHFFRKNSLPKLDFNNVLDYFDTLPNFKTFYSDDVVEILYSDSEFSFSYRYLITKQSRVAKIYDLNPMYSNVNFLLEMPVLIPSFLAKEILTLAQKISKLFDLEIYAETFDDVQTFNLVDVLVLYEQNLTQYIEEHGLQGKITYDGDKLNIICKYQRFVESLQDHYEHKVDVDYVIPVIDEDAGISGMSYTWQINKAAIFPPYIDYIYVIDNENQKILLTRDDFFRTMNKYFIEIKTFLPDLYMIKEKQARSTHRELKKLRKFDINAEYNLRPLRLSDVIEENYDK